MQTISEPLKIPLWQPSAVRGHPTPERLLWLKALKDGDKKAIQVEILKCRDPWYWLINWVLTENAHFQGSSPFESFPDEEALYYVVRIWEMERKNAWPKSRQIMMTWLMCCLFMHDAMWNPSRLNFVQSKKEEDSDEVLERAWTVYQKLPEFMRLWQPAKRTYCQLKFIKIRSRLWAIPEGAEHLRSYTGTGLLSDETVYQDDVQKMITAAGPALGTRGRLTMISSAGPSAFEGVSFDRLDASG